MAEISQLAVCGPPSEWSGSVAASLGPAGRRDLIRLWKSLSSEEQKEVWDKFAQTKLATTKLAIVKSLQSAHAVYQLSTTKRQRERHREKAMQHGARVPALRSAYRHHRKAKKKFDTRVEFLKKHAAADDPRLAGFFSKEKKKALRRTDDHHRRDDPGRWDDLMGKVQRKSFAQAMQRDERSDPKLRQHVDQMNRLATGKKLDTIQGRTGSYDIVRLRGGGLGCTCPDWRYRATVSTTKDGKDCRHIRAWRFRQKHEKRAGYSVEDAHRELTAAGVDWDDNEHFMEFCNLLVGKRHLDKMTPLELQEVVRAVKKAEGGVKTAESFASLKKRLEPGDIVLTTMSKSTQQGGRAVKTVDSLFRSLSRKLQGPYTHALMYVGNDEVVEAMLETGGRKISLSAATRGKGFAAVRPVLPKRKRAEAANIAKEHAQHIAYSGRDLVATGGHLLMPRVGARIIKKVMGGSDFARKKALQCGGLVAGSYAAANAELHPDVHWRFLAPALLLASPNVKVLGRVGAKKRVRGGPALGAYRSHVSDVLKKASLYSHLCGQM